MAQVLTWLFADGSSSVAEQDAEAAPQDMSVSSLRVWTPQVIVLRLELLAPASVPETSPISRPLGMAYDCATLLHVGKTMVTCRESDVAGCPGGHR